MRLFKHYTTFCLLAFLCAPALGQTAYLQADDPYYRTLVLKPGENPEQKVNSLIFLKVSASKTTVYAGETFLVEYKLYRAVESEPVPAKQPAFNGCSVLELNPFNDSTLQIIDGVRYHVSVLRKVQLMPLQDGPMVLDEATVNNTVQFTSQDSPGHVQTVVVETVSKPLTVQVKPLPEKDRPGNFTGIVGNFTIAAKVDNSLLRASENGRLYIAVKGTGDIADIALPAVSWPAGTEHFEGTSAQHVENDSFPASGDKTFEIPFIGSKEGTVAIPPVYFSFFNPATQKYDSAHTDSLNLTFTKATAKQILHQIVAENDNNGRLYLWLVPLIGVIVVFVVLITGRPKAKKNHPRTENEQEKPQPVALPAPVARKIDLAAELKALNTLTDNTVFFRRSKEFLTACIRQKLNDPTLYEDDVLQQLGLKSQDKYLVDAVERLYKTCNQNLYSPMADGRQKAAVLEALADVRQRLKA